MKKNFHAKNKGFTLIETMVAILLLAMTLDAAFSLIASSLYGSQYAKNDIVGIYLGQEVIDYIRNDRDTHMLQHDWAGFVSKYGLINGNASSECPFFQVAPGRETIQCSSPRGGGAAPSPLYFDDGVSYGSYYVTDASISGVIPTNFSRKVELALTGADEVDVTVTVSWQNGSNSKSRVLKTSLLNWQ